MVCLRRTYSHSAHCILVYLGSIHDYNSHTLDIVSTCNYVLFVALELQEVRSPQFRSADGLGSRL